MMKKTLVKLIAVLMALLISVGSTIAYLTDTDADVNVMTLGKVDIDLIEQNKDGSNFTQDKPLIPGVYDEDDLVPGEDGFWPDSVKNAVDKVVTVENTGNTPAYVRVWFAFEVTDEANFFAEKLHLNVNQGDWKWEFLPNNVLVTPDGQRYVMAAATYRNVLPADGKTPVSLRQVLLDSSATNADVAALGEKYSIFVVAQAVQAQGFNQPDIALDAGFGSVAYSNHPFAGMGEAGVDAFMVKEGEIEAMLESVPGGKDNINSIIFGNPSNYGHIIAGNYQTETLSAKNEKTGLLAWLFKTASADENCPKAYYKPHEGRYDVYVLYEGTICLPEDSKGMFQGCTNMKAFSAANLDASQVADMANFFDSCSNLTVVTIPEGAKEIAEDTFKGCGNLTAIDIPGSVVYIDDKAFANQPNVTLVVVENSKAKDWCDKNWNAENYTTLPYYWQNYGDQIKIINYFGAAAEVKVPETIDGLPVTILGDGTFNFRDYVTCIELPETIKEIESTVFVECRKLGKINIPAAVKTIRRGAFAACTSLTSVVLPDGLVCVDEEVFSGCANLTSVYIPDSVTRIGRRAFADCRSLKSITLPNGVTSIGSDAFNGCSSLTALTLPANLRNLGNHALAGMSSLRNITIPGTVKELPYELLAGNVMLQKVTLQSGITTLNNRVFYGCSNLESVNFPSTVTSIGTECLTGCNNVTATVYKDSEGHAYCEDYNVPYILLNASGNQMGSVVPEQGTTPAPSTTPGPVGTESYFEGYNMGGYATINRYKERELGLTVTDLVVPEMYDGAPVTVIGQNVFAAMAHVEKLTLPETVQEIAYGAFIASQKLTTVNIPESVYFIERDSFAMCSALKSIEIPEKLERIEANLFSGCSSLTSVTLHEGLRYIGDFAFYGCTSLESITIPRSVTEIAEGAFADCTNLKARVYKGSAAHTYCENNNVPYYLLNADGDVIATPAPTATPDPNATPAPTPNPWEIVYGPTDDIPFTWNITQDNQSVEINKYMGTADEAEVPAYIDGRPVTKLKLNAFANSDVKKITLPETLTEIEGAVFVNCWNMESINIPDSVTRLGDMTFWDCKALKSINIPKGISKIEAGTFGWCESLTEVNIPSNVTWIDEQAFYACESLTSVTIPKEVTFMDIDIFDMCTGDLVVTVYENSTAHEYCVSNNLNYKLLDANGNEIVGGDSGEEDTDSGITSADGLWNYVVSNGYASIKAYNGTEATVTLPATIDGYTVKALAAECFSGNTVLEHVTVPEGVTSIGEKAFYQDNWEGKEMGVKSVTLPSTITEMGSWVFNGCRLESFTLPTNITVVPDYVVYCNHKLTSITLHNGVTAIGEASFSNLPNLTSITIPSSVRTIGNYAFTNSGLTSVTIPSGVTTIGDGVFYYCQNLTSVTIPASVTSIGGDVFNDTSDALVVNVVAGSYAEEWCKNNWYGTYTVID